MASATMAMAREISRVFQVGGVKYMLCPDFLLKLKELFSTGVPLCDTGGIEKARHTNLEWGAAKEVWRGAAGKKLRRREKGQPLR
jgi:hypothetical protein